MFDHNCKQDHCPQCGQCHEVLNVCFTDACEAYVPLCVFCLHLIEPGAPKEVITYPIPGWYHAACYQKEAAAFADEQRREAAAERRNEEALYGYELPR